MTLRLKSPCERTHHCWPSTPSIVGCYMLRPHAHPVACCCMQVPTLLGVVASVCTSLQQLPTFLAQQYWGCFVRLHTIANNSKYCWAKNVGSCCIRLHTIANNSQHSWPNNIGSCCVRLHLALGTKLQIFHDSIVSQLPEEALAHRKTKPNIEK